MQIVSTHCDRLNDGNRALEVKIVSSFKIGLCCVTETRIVSVEVGSLSTFFGTGGRTFDDCGNITATILWGIRLTMRASVIDPYSLLTHSTLVRSRCLRTFLKAGSRTLPGSATTVPIRFMGLLGNTGQAGYARKSNHVPMIGNPCVAPSSPSILNLD